MLRDAGADVIGMGALFSYEFAQSYNAFKEKGIPAVCISNYSTLIDVAEQQKIIQHDQKGTLEDWRSDPANWRKEATV